MLETLTNTHIPPQQTENTAEKPRKVLHMVENERMGGKVPVWRAPETPQEQIADNLANAKNINTPSFKNTLAYTGTQIHEPSVHQQEFGFGDIIDMVNPLHHIPLVGHVYREATGDEIKPISNIIGGAVFGGAIGAAGGLINTIIEEETGKDITGNAMALALNGERPTLKNNNEPPQERLNDAITARENIPGNLLSFTNLEAGHSKNISIERINTANERTAGYFANKTSLESEQRILPPREPITQVRLSGLYALGRE